jgi:trigger factor
LIENKLSKDANIEVSNEDIKNHIRNFYYQNYFMQFNLADVEERLNQLAEEALKDQKQVKQLYDQLFDQKIMELLQSKMNVEELTGDFNQFVAFMTGKEPEVRSQKPEVRSQKSEAKSKKPKAGSNS